MTYFPSQTLADIAASLKNILNALVRPIFIDAASGRPNINNITTLSTVTTVSTVTGVTTVTNLTNMGTATYPAGPLTAVSLERTNWAHCVRARIS